MPRKYPRLAAELYNQPWLLTQSKLEEIEAVLVARSEGRITLTAEEIDRLAAANAPPKHEVGQDIQVLPIAGTIHHHASFMTRYSGGTSTTRLGREFMEAVNNPDIGTIVFECRSGGGSVFGTPELAELIFQNRENKKIIAHVNAYAYSACYYLAAAAHEIVCTPSGEVGSVGVVCMHTDVSKWEKKQGYKTTLIAVPEKKVETNPYEPLSADAHSDLMRKCEKSYEKFVSDLARFRGVSAEHVKKEFGGGGTLMAEDAMAAKMIDKIMTFDQLIEDVRATASPRTGRGNLNRLALAETQS